MPVRVDVAPDLLHWAVERARWDEETTARRAPKLDEWIAGTHRPTLKQLEKFASDTHAPFGLLFLDEPPVEELPIPDLRTIGDADVERPSADLLDTIYLCQERQEWYRGYAVEHGMESPGFVGSASVDDAPALVAGQIRELLEFEPAQRGVFSNWSDALRRLIDRIESVGVLVMLTGIVGSDSHRKLNPSEFRGFALADPVAPLIFINGADTKAAQNFTIIHEFAHIWLGGSALSDATMLARASLPEERWCNQVAAEVLVPVGALRADYNGDAGPKELEQLARRYRVSTLVVLKRIFDAGYLEWNEYRERYEAERERVMEILAAQRAEGGGGNYYYTQPIRLSRHFATAVISSAREGSTTYRDAYRLLGTRKHSTFEGLASELGVA